MKIGDLKQKAQMKLQEDQEALQKVSHESLENFKTNFQESIKNVAITIEKDINDLKEKTKILSYSTIKIYIINLIFFFVILISIVIISWGVISTMMKKIESLYSEIETLSIEKEKVQSTLTTMTAYGLILHEDKQGRFIILPPNLQGEIGWKIGNQNSIKLIEVQ